MFLFVYIYLSLQLTHSLSYSLNISLLPIDLQSSTYIMENRKKLCTKQQERKALLFYLLSSAVEMNFLFELNVCFWRDALHNSICTVCPILHGYCINRFVTIESRILRWEFKSCLLGSRNSAHNGPPYPFSVDYNNRFIWCSPLSWNYLFRFSLDSCREGCTDFLGPGRDTSPDQDGLSNRQ